MNIVRTNKNISCDLLDIPDLKPVMQETKKKTKRLSLTKRLLSRSKGVQTEVTANENEKKRNVSTASENGGYSETPPPMQPSSRKSSTSDMCDHCIMKQGTQPSADRNEWPIDKIELGYLEEICKLLDLDDRSKKPLLVALGCFTSIDAASIIKQFEPKGGKGIAKKALGIWGTVDRTHSVGALKKILSSMPRCDVLQVIENWEKLSVCHGCGITLKKPQ